MTTLPSSSHCNNCSIDNCKCLQRILEMLSKYQQWLYHEPNKNSHSLRDVLNELKSFQSYSNKIVVHDYKHIKQTNYNMSTNNILCPHSVSNCVPSSRHQRDNYKNYEQTYYTKDIKEILIQKLFDQIHLFLYHPLSYEKNNNHKNQRFVTNIKTENVLIKQNKKQLDDKKLDEKKAQMQEEENKYDNIDIEEIKQIVDPENNAYSFGQQFFYWEYAKNHKWFITERYNNLKDELLQNHMYKIDLIVWNEEYQNALDKLEVDERVKELLQIFFSLSRKLV